MDMLGSIAGSVEHRDAAERLKAWTRERFKLPDGAPILVSQTPCSLPGYPPLETLVAFRVDGKPHEFKLFKPVADIVENDLPPAWMKGALIPTKGAGCSCC